MIESVNRPYRIPIAFLLLVSLGISARNVVHAQSPEASPFISFPHPYKAWEWRVSAGLTLLTVPLDIAEEEINKAPALDIQARLGLPLQFSLEGRILLQYITNHFQAGLRWSQPVGSFGFSLGCDAVYWFGFMQVEGFDNRMQGTFLFPNVSAGYRLGEVKFTLKGEAILVTAIMSYAGENDLGSKRNTLAGGSLTFLMEQPFWKNQSVMLGVRVSLTQFHNQTWFAFSTFDRKLLFSELIFGFLL